MAELRVGVYHFEFETEEERSALWFPDVFQKIEKTPSRDQARFIKEDLPVRPRKVEILDQYCFADFSRINMIDDMHLSSLAGEEELLRFGGKKPSERTALIVDPHCNILYLHEHREGAISATNVAQYFREIVGLKHLLVKPVLKLEAMLRFRRQRRYTTLRVSLAGIENAQFLRDRGLSVGAVSAMIEEYNSPILKYEVSLEKGDEGTVDTAGVFGTISALVGLPRKNLKRLQVVGSEAPGAPDFPVDFIRDRITSSLEVELQKGSRLKDADRYRAVAQAWREHHTELRQRYLR